jgi:hypothetical protein
MFAFACRNAIQRHLAVRFVAETGLIRGFLCPEKIVSQPCFPKVDKVEKHCFLVMFQETLFPSHVS